MFRKEIINAFSDAPEVWTAEEPRTARRAADDIALKHIASARAAEEIRGATFPARPDLLRPDLLRPDLLRPDLLRPDLLRPDLLPLLMTFKAGRLRRITDAGTGADLTAEEADEGPPG
jgi:hypothetical protein